MSNFTLTTSNASVGGAQRCHILYCNAVIKNIDLLDREVGALVRVHVNYGSKTPYTYVPCMMDMGDEIELISRAEHRSRCETAASHGDDYTALAEGKVAIIEDSQQAAEAYRACLDTITKFDGLIKLGLFNLPVTFA